MVKGGACSGCSKLDVLVVVQEKLQAFELGRNRSSEHAGSCCIAMSTVRFMRFMGSKDCNTAHAEKLKAFVAQQVHAIACSQQQAITSLCCSTFGKLESKALAFCSPLQGLKSWQYNDCIVVQVHQSGLVLLPPTEDT